MFCEVPSPPTEQQAEWELLSVPPESLTLYWQLCLFTEVASVTCHMSRDSVPEQMSKDFNLSKQWDWNPLYYFCYIIHIFVISNMSSSKQNFSSNTTWIHIITLRHRGWRLPAISSSILKILLKQNKSPRCCWEGSQTGCCGMTHVQ